MLYMSNQVIISQVRGNVILISADIPSSMEKILPQEQSLFAVNFKRKLSYEGYFLSEVIDKNKVVAWYNWLKKNLTTLYSINNGYART